MMNDAMREYLKAPKHPKNGGPANNGNNHGVLSNSTPAPGNRHGVFQNDTPAPNPGVLRNGER